MQVQKERILIQLPLTTRLLSAPPSLPVLCAASILKCETAMPKSYMLREAKRIREKAKKTPKQIQNLQPFCLTANIPSLSPAIHSCNVSRFAKTFCISCQTFLPSDFLRVAWRLVHASFSLCVSQENRTFHEGGHLFVIFTDCPEEGESLLWMELVHIDFGGFFCGHLLFV